MYKVQKQQKYENNYNNIIQRLCSDYYVGDQLALAYREPSFFSGYVFWWFDTKESYSIL